MPHVIDVPGHGLVEFPDSMTDAQIVAAIKANPATSVTDVAKQAATGVANAVSDIPTEIAGAAKSAASSINKAFNPYSGEPQGIVNTGRGLAGIAALAASPITGTGRALIGHLLAAPGQISYEEGKNQADLAMMGLGARGPVGAAATTADAASLARTARATRQAVEQAAPGAAQAAAKQSPAVAQAAQAAQASPAGASLLDNPAVNVAANVLAH